MAAIDRLYSIASKWWWLQPRGRNRKELMYWNKENSQAQLLKRTTVMVSVTPQSPCCAFTD